MDSLVKILKCISRITYNLYFSLGVQLVSCISFSLVTKDALECLKKEFNLEFYLGKKKKIPDSIF